MFQYTTFGTIFSSSDRGFEYFDQDYQNFKRIFGNTKRYSHTTDQYFQNEQEAIRQSIDYQIFIKNPTSHKVIKELPIIKYTKTRATLIENCDVNDCKCTICLDSFKTNEEVCVLYCNHMFHKKCIMPWLKKHNTCPICRFELPLDDQEEEKIRKKKMIKKFTKTGMEIMEIGSLIETIFSKIEAKMKLKKKYVVLKECNSKLMRIMLYLDSYNKFKNMKIRDDRKFLIIKIQHIQSIIDTRLKRITIL